MTKTNTSCTWKESKNTTIISHKPRKVKRGKLLDTDIIESGVEFLNKNKWLKVPENSIIMGATVNHLRLIEEDCQYRYPKGFKSKIK